MALVWQKTLSLDRSSDTFNNYAHFSRGTLPHKKTEIPSLIPKDNSFLHFQKLRESLVESRRAFLNNFQNIPAKPATQSVQQQSEDTKAENGNSEYRKPPSKKISFKIKKTSSIYKRSQPPASKVTTISANKVAELTQKFNRMVAENSAILEEPKFKKLVKRVNSQRSVDSDCVKVSRNPSVKTKEYGVKVTRKPSIKTKPNRVDEKNIFIVKATVQRNHSIKSCDKNDRTSDKDNKGCVRAKISYLETPHTVQKNEEQTLIRPKTLQYADMKDTDDVQVSPNSGTVRATIEIFERRTLQYTSLPTIPNETPKTVLKPKVPEKKFTLRTREIIAKNYKNKMKIHEETPSEIISTYQDENSKPESTELNINNTISNSENETLKNIEDVKTDFEEVKVQIVNIPATLPHLKCDSRYETLTLKKTSPPKQVLKLDLPEETETDNIEKPSLLTAEIKPNTSFLWSRNQDKSPSSYKPFISREKTGNEENEDDSEALYDFVDPKANVDVTNQAQDQVPQIPPKPSNFLLKPPALPPKIVKKKMPLPEDKIYEELNSKDSKETDTVDASLKNDKLYEVIGKEQTELESSTEEKVYEDVDSKDLLSGTSKDDIPDEKIYEELNNKEMDNGYEYCETSAKYEDVEPKTDDGYEYCASPKEENIYETLPPKQNPPSLPRRHQQEPLPPRPQSRSSYYTIQNGEVVSNCYESIYAADSTSKKEIDNESNYESIYGCQIRGGSSNRDSVVSSDQQSNSLYGRFFNGYGDDQNAYNGKATSELSSSDRSDEWVDMSDNEDNENNMNSNIIIVRERQKNKKASGWSQQFEQWSKSPKKVPTILGVDSDSDHHYETLATTDHTPHDDDYDSFDSDSESESSYTKVNLTDSGVDIANNQLPDPPNNQAYMLTRLAATAGKHMRKLRRNWSLTKNDISRSLSRMTKRKSRTDLEIAGTTKKEEKIPREETPAIITIEPINAPEVPSRKSSQTPDSPTSNVSPYQNVMFPSTQNLSQTEQPGEKMKSKSGFLSKFRRSMSMNPEAASELTSTLESKPKSTFYLTETIDVDAISEKRVHSQVSPDSGISVSPPARRNNKSALTRPQSPPPPVPIQNNDKKGNKKDRKSTSWYAEVGLFKNTENSIQTHQPKKTNTFWYAEVGLYQAQASSTPSTSSAENSGNNTNNVEIKQSDFINQDNNEEYYNLKNESDYYNSSVKSFSSMDTKKDESLTNIAPDIQLRLQDEPLYQFYDAAVLESVCKDGTADTDSDGYEEVGENRNSELRSSLRPSAMDLVCPKRNSIAFTRTLWCEIPEVIQSSVLSTLSPHQRKIQEAKFEMITSEASYLNSLNVLNDHFIMNLKNYESISIEEWNILFGKVSAVKHCSEKLLLDMEKCWQDNILLNGVCDIVLRHAEENFSVYVSYCENQVFLDDTLKNLKERQSIYDHLRKLESSSACQSLTLYSFLLLPMQRITRWPLLVDAILRRLSPEDSEYVTCQRALATLNKIVNQCNEAARKKEREKEMKKIASQLEFAKGVPPIEIVSLNRWLIRSGPITHMTPRNDETLLTFGKRFTKNPLHLFLFNDFLFVTKLKSENCYTVIHYCAKNLVELNTTDTLLTVPVKDAQGKNLLFLTILENQDAKTIEFLMSCNSETDKERWIEAFLPPKSEDPDEVLYERWDCPQVTVIHNYNATQPDELALSRGDIINVLQKMPDGWYHGERIRDGQTGWFPSNYTVEIANPHVRARNLKQRYRLLALSECYLKSK